MASCVFSSSPAGSMGHGSNVFITGPAAPPPRPDQSRDLLPSFLPSSMRASIGTSWAEFVGRRQTYVGLIFWAQVVLTPSNLLTSTSQFRFSLTRRKGRYCKIKCFYRTSSRKRRKMKILPFVWIQGLNFRPCHIKVNLDIYKYKIKFNYKTNGRI